MSGINSFIVDISKDGIQGSGGIYGTYSPQLGNLAIANLQENRLRINTRRVFLQTTISASGFNYFTIPVTFGFNKAVIYVNGKLYLPNKDYIIQFNTVIWKNLDISLTPSDEVIVWGPANEYTANAITFEYVNLKDLLVYSGSGNTINLKANGGDNIFFPYSTESIWLFINGDSYIPGSSYDYDYNPATKTLTLHAAAHPVIDPNNDEIFMFYCNLLETQPFRLGDALTRFQEDTGSSNISLTNPIKSELINSANIFLNKTRANIGENYSFKFPLLKWDQSSDMPYASGDVMDISYFADLEFGVNMYNEVILGNNFTRNSIGGTVTVSNLPVEDKKGLLFANGILSVGPVYDNVSPTYKDYELSGTTLNWIGEPSIADTVDNDIVNAYKFIWSGFGDIFSKQYIGLKYVQNNTVSHTLPNIADLSKVIYFLNGQAKFFQQGELTVTAGNPATVNLVGAPVLTDAHIVLLYFTQFSYANLWKFQAINPILTWTEGSSVTLDKPAKNLDTTFVFINGVRAIPGVDYDLSSSGNGIRNLSMGNITTGQSIMVVYI